MPNFVAVGECTVELAPAPNDSGGPDCSSYTLGYACDTLNTAWYARALLPTDAEGRYVTALGADEMSDRAASFVAAAGIGTDDIARIAGRTVSL